MKFSKNNVDDDIMIKVDSEDAICSSKDGVIKLDWLIDWLIDVYQVNLWLDFISSFLKVHFQCRQITKAWSTVRFEAISNITAQYIMYLTGWWYDTTNYLM